MVSAACIVCAQFNVSALPTRLFRVLGGEYGAGGPRKKRQERQNRKSKSSLRAADDEIWIFSDIMYIMQGGVSYGWPSKQRVWLH